MHALIFMFVRKQRGFAGGSCHGQPRKGTGSGTSCEVEHWPITLFVPDWLGSLSEKTEKRLFNVSNSLWWVCFSPPYSDQKPNVKGTVRIWHAKLASPSASGTKKH